VKEDTINTEIYLPGKGMVPINAVTASNAVSDYDSDLTLGRVESTGIWTVFVKNGPNGMPFPVFELGTELPPYDVIQRKLYESDVRRHGHKIVEQVQRRNDARSRELDLAGHDAAAETAEHIEHGMRKLGMLPSLRIFVPSGKG
jgi:hypothetical protein